MANQLAPRYEHRDSQSGVTFVINGKLPRFNFQKTKKIEEIVMPIRSAVQSLRKEHLVNPPIPYDGVFFGDARRIADFSKGAVQERIANHSLDKVGLSTRLQDFKIELCNVELNFGGNPVTKYELAVVQPDGEMHTLTLATEQGLWAVQYREVQYRYLASRTSNMGIIFKSMGLKGSSFDDIPFERLLNNTYYFEREEEFALKHEDLLSKIIEKSIADNPIWKLVSCKNPEERIYVKAAAAGDKQVKKQFMGNNVSIYLERPANPMIDELVIEGLLVKGGLVQNVPVFTQRKVEVYELPGGKFGVFSLGDLAAVTDGEEISYSPAIAEGGMKETNYTRIMIPINIVGEDKAARSKSFQFLKKYLSRIENILAPIGIWMTPEAADDPTNINVCIHPLARSVNDDDMPEEDSVYQNSKEILDKIIDLLNDKPHLIKSAVSGTAVDNRYFKP